MGDDKDDGKKKDRKKDPKVSLAFDTGDVQFEFEGPLSLLRGEVQAIVHDLVGAVREAASAPDGGTSPSGNAASGKKTAKARQTSAKDSGAAAEARTTSQEPEQVIPETPTAPKAAPSRAASSGRPAQRDSAVKLIPVKKSAKKTRSKN